jgi:hypothetical protein
MNLITFAGTGSPALNPTAVLIGAAALGLFGIVTAAVLVVCNSHGGHDPSMKAAGAFEATRANFTFQTFRYLLAARLNVVGLVR